MIPWLGFAAPASRKTTRRRRRRTRRIALSNRHFVIRSRVRNIGQATPTGSIVRKDGGSIGLDRKLPRESPVITEGDTSSRDRRAFSYRTLRNATAIVQDRALIDCTPTLRDRLCGWTAGRWAGIWDKILGSSSIRYLNKFRRGNVWIKARAVAQQQSVAATLRNAQRITRTSARDSPSRRRY